MLHKCKAWGVPGASRYMAHTHEEIPTRHASYATCVHLRLECDDGTGCMALALARESEENGIAQLEMHGRWRVRCADFTLLD